MTDPHAALNGRLVPLHDARLSICDDGIVQGATVTERIRTFARQPFWLNEHLVRLFESVRLTGIAQIEDDGSLHNLIGRLGHRNADTIPAWEDFAFVIVVTPGLNRSLSRGAESLSSEREAGPTICVHTTSVTQPHWARQAADGVSLVTPTIRQIPAEIIDPHIKHRSRLHWYLADQQARRIAPHAAALLLNAAGHVTETSTGNLILYDGERLLSPRPEYVLEGLSLQFLSEKVFKEMGLELVRRDLTPADVMAAEEVFLSSTGYCLLPVTRLNDRPIGAGRPGHLYHRLMAAWSRIAGIDILAQFNQAAAHHA